MIYDIPRNFVLDNFHIEKIENWMESQIEKDDTQPLLGERWQYSFTPTGMGTLIDLKDLITGDVLEVEGTEYW